MSTCALPSTSNAVGVVKFGRKRLLLHEMIHNKVPIIQPVSTTSSVPSGSDIF